jgi:DinB superfamily
MAPTAAIATSSFLTMPIVPDTKDWTWVLERPCEECGFDASTFPRDEVPTLLRDNVGQWQELLTATDPELLTRRPSEDRWSALEYACHVRDVFRIYDYRLGLMLGQDDPSFPNWDQDASAVEERYNEQDAGNVTRDLLAAGTTLAASFDGVTGVAWERTGNRSDGARFTVDTFARYMVHDPVHHLVDVQRGLAAL